VQAEEFNDTVRS